MQPKYEAHAQLQNSVNKALNTIRNIIQTYPPYLILLILALSPCYILIYMF